MTVFVLPADQQLAHGDARRLYERVQRELAAILPASCRILHVGATAIPDCLTKGDLDIVVRCDAVDFALADRVLAHRFERNTGSVRYAEFSAFEDKNASPECGIQLTIKGGTLDFFHLFAGALLNDPALFRRFNDLKRAYDGQPMDAYRLAKNDFVTSVLGAQS